MRKRITARHILDAFCALLSTVGYCGVTLTASAGQFFQIKDLVQQSTLIVVGQVQSATIVDSGWLINISVDRTLKGNVQPQSSLTIQFSFPPGYRGAKTASPVRALWFLQSGSANGQWTLLPAETGRPWFESALYPVNSATPPRAFPYTGTTSVLDKVISELAQAAEDFNGGPGFGDRLPFTLHPEDSALMATVYNQWASSSSINVQALGLLGLLLQDNADAMVSFAAKATAYAESPCAVPLMAAVNEFRNIRTDAVGALGTLALKGPAAFRLRAAYALRSIHTAGVLPVLNSLLASSDPLLQEQAVSGMSAFAFSIPVAKSGPATAAAMDSALNPANQNAGQQNASVRASAHFGPFANAAEQAQYVQFWKAWYAGTAASLKPN